MAKRFESSQIWHYPSLSKRIATGLEILAQRVQNIVRIGHVVSERFAVHSKRVRMRILI